MNDGDSKMVKVSVIIPVYNGEEHLRQCLDSVCGQTLREIEIICVDDGSTDSSCDILQEYAQADARVTVLRQQNLYAGIARNHGKEHAQGEYLAFWDCDDYFEPECLELMYQKAAEYHADICVCGGNQYFEEQKLAVISPRHLAEDMLPEKEVFSREDIPEYILTFTCIPAWNKIYRRSFVEENKLEFQGVRNGNDVFFTVSALCLAQSITAVRRHLVYYRITQGTSLVGTMTKRPLDIINTWMHTANYLSELGCFPEQSFANRALESMIYLLQHLTDWESFSQAVGLLQSEGLEKLHIQNRDDGFYYKPFHCEFAHHLWQDTPQDLLVYMCNHNYNRFSLVNAQKRTLNLKLKKKNAKIQSLREKNEELKGKNEKLLGRNEELMSKNTVLNEEIGQLKKEQEQMMEELRRKKGIWSFFKDKISCL